MVLTLAIYIGLVLGLTWAELKEIPKAQQTLKPAAALGFIFIAVISGALDHQYGKLILFGLAACAAGDLLLLSRTSQKLFLAGMAAFAIGHLAYISAFVGIQPYQFSVSGIIQAGVILFIGAGIYVWLNPHLPKDMRFAVKIYVFIILMMVITALELPARGPLTLAIAGAVMFAMSDIFVARDRFVTPSPRNTLAITPLYFGAQALIALSTIPAI